MHHAVRDCLAAASPPDVTDVAAARVACEATDRHEERRKVRLWRRVLYDLAVAARPSIVSAGTAASGLHSRQGMVSRVPALPPLADVPAAAPEPLEPPEPPVPESFSSDGKHPAVSAEVRTNMPSRCGEMSMFLDVAGYRTFVTCTPQLSSQETLPAQAAASSSLSGSRRECG